MERARASLLCCESCRETKQDRIIDRRVLPLAFANNSVRTKAMTFTARCVGVSVCGVLVIIGQAPRVRARR